MSNESLSREDVAAPPAGLAEEVAQKRALRRTLRAWLASVSPAERAAAGDAAAARLAALPVYRSARRLAVYWAMPDEMPTAPLIRRAWEDGRELAIPAWDAATRSYRLAHFEADLPLERGPHGIPQPAQPRWMSHATIELWVVPGLAFSMAGVRLGRGGGWYDRLLAGVSAPRVGWALEGQIQAELPAASHDVRMHWIVTERRVIECACRT